MQYATFRHASNLLRVSAEATTNKRTDAGRSGAAPVLLVHGLFLGAWATRPLAARLRGHGFAPSRFGYRTVSGHLQGNVSRLVACIESLAGGERDAPARRVHCVAHSLGALLLRHALALHPHLPVAASVLLGPPNRGSQVARRLSDVPGGTALLGCGLAHGLDGSAPDWPTDIPVRIIAGTRALGLGRLVPGLAVPNDGTVALEETRLAGVGEPLVLDETHTSMLLSARVAEAVAEFLAANPDPG